MLYVNGNKVCISKQIKANKIGITRELSNQGTFQMPTSNFTFSLPSNAIDLEANTLYNAFANCTYLTSVDLSSLTSVSGDGALANAFYFCTHLASADLSSLTSISGYGAMQYAFYSCTSLTSLDLSSLQTVSGSQAMYGAFFICGNITSVSFPLLTTVYSSDAMNSTFYGSSIASVNFPILQTIGTNSSSTDYSQFASCFSQCRNLASLAFPELEAIYCTGPSNSIYGTFDSNNKVQKMYFPKLHTITYGTGASSSNQGACQYIFSNCDSLTELHFGAANQAAIEASPGYSTAWGRGAGNVTIYFDL